MPTSQNYIDMIQSPLFQDGPTVLFVWENVAGWPVKAVSSNIKTLYGYEDSDYTSQKLVYADQIHPADLQRVFLEVQEASISSANSFTHAPYRYQAEDGSYRWIKDTTLMIRDENNEVTHYVGYINDITDLMSTQALLQEKEERYQSLFTISPVGLSLNRMDGSFVEINAALHNMCGYTEDEFLQLSYWDITPEKYADQERAQLKCLTQTGRYGPYAKEYIHKNGQAFPVILNGAIFKDRFGTEYIWSIVQDVSELASAYEEAKENKARFKALFNASNDGLFIHNEAMQFEECNPSFYEMIGYDADEISQMTPMDISPEFQADGISTADKAEKIITKVFGGERQIFEWQHVKKDGTLLDVEVSLNLMKRDGKDVVIGSWRDISERKRSEKALKEINENLRQSQLDAERANRAKSTFLANVSHEIRTPMNAILGFVELLSREETNPERQIRFKHIRDSGESLLSIINDTLDFSKIESEKLTIQHHSFAPADLFDSIQALFTEVASEKNIRLEYIHQSLPKALIGDSLRIKQVVTNLLSNAIKFTPDDGKIIFCVAYDDKKQQLSFSVEDNGKGIKPENMQKIFQPFQQEDDSTTREFGGTGLGLTISSSLVEMMKGSLDLQSEYGKGSCFSVVIPLEVDHNILESKEQTDPLPEKFQGHLLVVEDNLTNQALLKIYLEEMGLSFDIANDGVEGVKAFKEHRYDLVLMDENMPRMNGIEATIQMQAFEKEQGLKPTPIVAVTANALQGDKERFLAVGMVDYISKPFNDKDLKRVFVAFL